MSVASGMAAVGLLQTFTDTVKGAFSKETEMGINVFKTQKLGTAFPVDVSILTSLAVSSFADPDGIVRSMNYFGFDPSPPTREFFQFSNMVYNHPDAMLGIRNLGNIPDVKAFEDSTSAAIWSQQVTLNVGDILTLLNREQLSRQAATWYLQKNGIRDEGTQNLVMSMRNEIPGVPDLIRFAVRDAFTPAIVEKYGYAEEYPTAIDRYISWQGLGWPTGYKSPGGTDEKGNKRPEHDATWGEISWYAHWELPSPTQAYDMYHMLYPNSRFGPSPYVRNPDGTINKDTVFTADDLSTLLKTADYPVYWRKRLEAISNPPLTRVDTRRMYQLGIIDEPTVYHQYRAQGYDDANAWALTRYTVADVRPDISKYVCSLYKAGILDNESAIALLMKGKMSQLQAETFLSKCRLEETTELITKTVNGIHSGYIHGSLSRDQAEALLSQLGIIGERIGRYVDQWDLERAFSERVPALRNILGWYQDGVIDRDNLIGRLQRLNYSDSAVTSFLKSADSKKSIRAAKEAQNEVAQQAKTNKERERQTRAAVAALEKARAKEEKELAKRNAALEKAAKEQAKQLDDVAKLQSAELKAQQEQLEEYRKHLAAASTDKNIITWYKAGLIDIPDVRLRLAARKFLPADAERWIDSYLGGLEDATGTSAETE